LVELLTTAILLFFHITWATLSLIKTTKIKTEIITKDNKQKRIIEEKI